MVFSTSSGPQMRPKEGEKRRVNRLFRVLIGFSDFLPLPLPPPSPPLHLSPPHSSPSLSPPPSLLQGYRIFNTWMGDPGKLLMLEVRRERRERERDS